MKPKRRCAYCTGPFGLIVHRHWLLTFCSRKCKRQYLAREEKKVIEAKRRWLAYLAPK